MNAIQKILGFIGNASLRDDCRVRVRYKKLHPDAVAPFRAHPSDAGADLTAVGVEEDLKRGIVTYHTGLALEIPEGHVGLLFPRSSIYRHQVVLRSPSFYRHLYLHVSIHHRCPSITHLFPIPTL